MPRRTDSSVSSSLPLFPFLGVFICAGGALTTLVYGYEQRCQQLNVSSAEAAAMLAKSDEFVMERDDLEWRIGQLQQAREKTQQRLTERQLELSHVEDHTRRLREQAEQLQLALDELQKQDGTRLQQSTDADGELKRIRRAIVLAERDLHQTERDRRAQPVVYSVVPYEGQNQTKRRPIYIECRKDAVVLQPEGVALRDHDFEPPLGPGNPLAASIRAYCEHLNRAGFTTETTRPYPLLLVRPDGIEAYYAARSALQSWGTEFGYELIGADWALDFPPADGDLSAKLQQVVADARLRQGVLAAEAPRQYKRPRSGLRASPNGKGFVSDGDRDGGRGYGGNGFAARRSRRNGFGSGAPGGERGWGSASRGTGSPEQGTTSTDVGSGGADDGLGGSQFAANSSTPQNDGRGQHDSFGMSHTGGNDSNSEPSSPHGDGSRPFGSSSTGNSSSHEKSEGPQLGDPSGTPGEGRGASPSSITGERGGKGENNLGPMGSPGRGFQTDSRQTAGGSGSSRLGGQPGEASSTTTAGSTGSGSASPSESQPSQSLTAQVSPGASAKSLSHKRGRDWGLPEGADQMTPVTRPVVIRCEINQLTIVPDDNRSPPQKIPLKARTEDTVDQLVSGVWDHMKGWGLAGRGMYWRPTLVMDVAPGAETRFRELQTLLQGSGLEVKQRQRN